MNTYIDIWSCKSSVWVHYGITVRCSVVISTVDPRHVRTCQIVRMNNTVGIKLFMCVIDTGVCVL